MHDLIKFWAVVPAAGVGKRMNADRPKQYLELAGKTVIEHTLLRLIKADIFTGVAVAISEEDPYWPELEVSTHEKIIVAAGGKERADSVLSALKSIRAMASDDDWVLVHDAARPCITRSDIHFLIDALTAAEGNPAITDEASALELLGLQPKIVEGRPDNIKITRPEDLALAQFYMEQQHD